MTAPPRVRPDTINRLVNAVYPGFALLAGMQLDVFTPLADGPRDATSLAAEMGVRPALLETVLHALVAAGLLTVDEGRFVNTPEAERFLVQGSKAYIGSNHEVFSDLWSAALKTAETVRAGTPQAKHDFAAMSPSYFPAELPFHSAPNSIPMAMARIEEVTELMERLLAEVPEFATWLPQRMIQ